MKFTAIVLLFSCCHGDSPFFSLDSCLPPAEQLKPSEVMRNGAFEKISFPISHLDKTMHRPTVRVMPSTLAPILTVGWNSSGNIVNASGYAPYLLDLIAKSTKLTYCWMPIGRDLPVDDNPAVKKGLIGYLVEGSADLIVGPLVRNPARDRLIDFTIPFAEGPFSIMIPFPEKTVNRSALSQPFQTFVWIGLLVTLTVVTISLYIVQSALECNKGRYQSSVVRPNLESKQDKLYNHFSYAVTVLLGQGNYFADKVTTIRFIAGAWCLAVSVLVPAYSGTLLSFVTKPTSKPVVGSIFDVVRVPGLKVAVDAWRAADLRLKALAEENSTLGMTSRSILKTLFRCNASSQCIDKVMSGDFVYIHGEAAVDQMMIVDLAEMGNCRFSKAKESFQKGYMYWGISKNSPYRQDFDIGLAASGLLDFWRHRFMKTAEECLRPDNQKSLGNSRLTLSQLAITFAPLGIGYSLGFLSFVIEKYCVHIYRTCRRPK